jgi:hypothetical protein
MPDEDHSGNAPPIKGRNARHWTWLAAAILLVLAGLFTANILHHDDTATATLPSNPIGQSSLPPTTSLTDSKNEIVKRLKEILALRGRAYKERDLEILKQIYTVDCPCLNSDSNAIRELIKSHYRWVGGEASLHIRRTERVTPRMWVIVADFSSASLRIETESGRLVREEPQGQDLFQFVLAKPTGSSQWLLGHASSYQSG